MLERHLPADAPALAPGPLVTTAGEVIGEHHGYARYTIGQRKGLPGGFAEPRFVVAIRPERREVVIGTVDELAGHRVRLEELNWLADPLGAGDACEVQIRHRARAVPATVWRADSGRSSSRSRCRCGRSRRGSPACSTAAGRVLGGGVIDSRAVLSGATDAQSAAALGVQRRGAVGGRRISSTASTFTGDIPTCSRWRRCSASSTAWCGRC